MDFQSEKKEENEENGDMGEAEVVSSDGGEFEFNLNNQFEQANK